MGKLGRPAVSSMSMAIDLEKQKKSAVEPFQIYDKEKIMFDEFGKVKQENGLFWANYEID